MSDGEVADELIELRGLRFFYRDWAGPAADAPVVVLLHGYTGHARSWDSLAAALSARFRVLALDQRGHGQTGWATPDRYDTVEMVDDLEAFVAALGLQRFLLVGLSMGGIVSFAYAGRRPAALAKLVIVDIAPEIDTLGLERIRTGVARPDVFATREDAFAQARADNPVPPEDEHRHRVYHSLMRTADGHFTYRYDRALRDPANPRKGIPPEAGWKLVASIQVPTLVVRGEDSDIMGAATAQRMVEAIADCRLVEIAGSGHPVPLDKPMEFRAALDDFL
ncbi:MAG: alpha/beta hydrolase [Pseudomonadales bacterium]